MPSRRSRANLNSSNGWVFTSPSPSPPQLSLFFCTYLFLACTFLCIVNILRIDPVFHFHIFFLSVVCCCDLCHPGRKKRERVRRPLWARAGNSDIFDPFLLERQWPSGFWAASAQVSFLVMDTTGSYLAHSLLGCEGLGTPSLGLACPGRSEL